MAQKTKFSISGEASSFRGDSRNILECPGNGIRFITITPIFCHHMTGLIVNYNILLGHNIFGYYINTEESTGRLVKIST